MKTYEILPIKLDIDEIRHTVLDHVKQLGNPIFQGEQYGFNDFGGYSLLSTTGHWKDGWEVGGTGIPGETILTPGKVNYKAAKYLGLTHSFENSIPTEACVGPIKDAIDKIAELGFYPRRARISMLKAGTKTILHSDAPKDRYSARIHIPIITTPECLHYGDGECFHMPADGSVYMIWVNIPHQVFNNSSIDRYHIIMDAWDTKGITEHFKFTDNINNIEEESNNFRQQLNNTIINNQEQQAFDMIKSRFEKEIKRSMLDGHR